MTVIDDADPTHRILQSATPGSVRERWIAEAAYYRAHKRGFAPGFALEDWLSAEGLVDFEMSRGLLKD
jgi:hypothetical protein